MKSFFAFFKKECLEFARTYKLFLMGTLFFILGIMNPLTAKYMPDLMDEFLPEGMVLNLPEPSAMDSWLQFFKNVPQLGLIILVLLFSGMIAHEISKGTLINVLTKGLPRHTVLISKFSFAVIIWTLSYWFCFGVSFLYTWFFWKTATPALLFAVFCVWLFGILLIALTLLGGVLFTTVSGTLLFTGAVVVFMFVLNILPKLQKFNPIRLVSANMELLSESLIRQDFFWAIGITLLLSVGSLVASIAIFNRKLL